MQADRSKLRCAWGRSQASINELVEELSEVGKTGGREGGRGGLLSSPFRHLFYSHPPSLSSFLPPSLPLYRSFRGSKIKSKSGKKS